MCYAMYWICKDYFHQLKENNEKINKSLLYKKYTKWSTSVISLFSYRGHWELLVNDNLKCLSTKCKRLEEGEKTTLYETELE